MRVSIILITLVVLVIYLVGRLFNAKVKHTSYTIKTNDLEKKQTLCFISDFHYTGKSDVRKIKKMIATINSKNYDIVIFGGDFVSRTKKQSTEKLKWLLKEFTKIDVNLKIAVLGNHDYDNNYNSLDLFQLFHENGIQLLVNNQIMLTENITIIGVDDYKRGNPQLELLNEENMNIVVSHNPDYFQKLLNVNFDIGLSGHTHAGQGQIFGWYPMMYKVSKFGQKFRYGKINLDANKIIVVTSGIGAHFKLRYFNYPEIVTIELERREKNDEL